MRRRSCIRRHDFVYFFGMKKASSPQQRFLSRCDDLQLWRSLLDLIPDIAFFLKDRQGRFVMQNRRACEYCRVSSEEETLGKTDYDFYPKDRADLYVDGDRRVMATGKPIVNEIAPAPEDAGSDRLIVYSKLPVRDRRGRIIGVLGLHREIQNKSALPQPFGRFLPAVQHIHRHYAEPLRLPLLASLSGLSRSQFERSFRRLFQIPPRRYLLQVRVHAACRLLEQTDRTTCDIAQETGFFDHSHFARTFRQVMGVTPRQYRLRHFGLGGNAGRSRSGAPPLVHRK